MSEHVMTAGVDEGFNRVAVCVCGVVVHGDSIDALATAIGNHVLGLDDGDACPEDPDGQHFVGCGCDASEAAQDGSSRTNYVLGVGTAMAAIASAQAAAHVGGWERVGIALLAVASITAAVLLATRRSRPASHGYVCPRPGCGTRITGAPEVWIAATLGARHEQEHRNVDLEAWRRQPFRGG